MNKGRESLWIIIWPIHGQTFLNRITVYMRLNSYNETTFLI